MKNVFIIGSKGIPANYGGFETFVHKLTEYKKSDDIKYHVACMSDNDNEFEFNGARCFNVKTPNIGPAKAVYYDIAAMKKVMKYVKKNNIQDSILYILACRIGPFLNIYKNKLKKLGIKVFINPDGHEWKRSKWNDAIKAYWKYSEKLMIKNGDYIVCDSIGIEKYINDEYKIYSPKTTFIAYGADVNENAISNEAYEKLEAWYKKFNISKNGYYLIVGRFVPENNYELMIKEFMKSDSKEDLVIITNVEQNSFYDKLKESGFEKDRRIKFVGTVYDQEMLVEIRRNAFAYLHGHEVGGTNPSLLEALATTRLNILLNVVFNKEVGKDGAVYFDKTENSLKNLIFDVEGYSQAQIKELSEKAKDRINKEYSWDYIVKKYEKLFLDN
ncbi:beta 1-4 rhamnosyltransferase Cps2T [Clostridium fallax]|uniref:Rhamnosyltransferase n=1 Tax=Clostridium fallax TaxID=1533 RepID=A0A1M4SYQ8_9CLOT|nr:DUF1972 domain-containing protein [Clostridium fallax]SHE37325.1 rhamnosyltransferase [Clostridium fallax]SQB08036.1 glycosyltransferase [Clostridium fallax]